jgi:hypothetical protein
MSVVTDDFADVHMNDLGDPVAMLSVLEGTPSSKTGTNFLRLSGVVTMMLGKN